MCHWLRDITLSSNDLLIIVTIIALDGVNQVKDSTAWDGVAGARLGGVLPAGVIVLVNCPID